MGFKIWTDEKYLIDDRDLPLTNIDELSDIFTSYRKTVEPLRDHPREALPTPSKGALPPFPPKDSIPAQRSPFNIPDTLDNLQSSLLKPLSAHDLVKNPPSYPESTILGGRGAIGGMVIVVGMDVEEEVEEEEEGMVAEDMVVREAIFVDMDMVAMDMVEEVVGGGRTEWV